MNAEKVCPFCDQKMVRATTGEALKALGLNAQNSMLGKLLGDSFNPKSQVYRCPACGFIALFA